ncbi:MAG: hypothetical protein QW569_01170 [Candidatus Bathyarchaeia archaeon]|nr:hypothetical protein [Candidatus Bathyarchaeota archaeon]
MALLACLSLSDYLEYAASVILLGGIASCTSIVLFWILSMWLRGRKGFRVSAFHRKVL